MNYLLCFAAGIVIVPVVVIVAYVVMINTEGPEPITEDRK